MDDVSDLAVLTSIVLPEWELHGLVAGAVVGTPGLDESRATSSVNELRPGLCQPDLLRELCSRVRTSVEDNDLTFQMLLPQDDESLKLQAEALGIWVESFLEAFERIDPPKSEEIEEILSDFKEIAEIDSNVQNTPEMELSFEEVMEFVRIGTIALNDAVKRATE